MSEELVKVVVNELNHRNSMVNEDASAVDDVNGDGTLVYVGYAKNGIADAATGWKIMKVTKTVNVTRMTYPLASKGYDFIWANRATYTYS